MYLVVFYTSDQVSTGDSIVKKANSNTYQKYEKDYNGNYDFVKEYNYSLLTDKQFRHE